MTAWADRALAQILGAVADTESVVDERFPFSAEPAAGQWKTTRRGSWTGGFWAGQLWLAAKLTGQPGDVATARRWAERLTDWTNADTVTRGLIFWYGVAAGSRLGMDTASEPAARSAAKALAAGFDAESGVVPWGTAFGDPASPLLARSDGVPGTIGLLSWASQESVAAQHLHTHLELVNRLGGHAWAREVSGWKALDEPPPGWTRGDAWLLLATADGALWLDPAFHQAGRHRAACLPPGFPAVRGVSGCPPDTSAAAITAVALCKLGLLDEAAELTRSLVRNHVQDGRLWDGCHDLARGIATAHQLVWGDFFLLLALAILTEAVPADAL